jgi:hypothetical protein
LISRLIQEINCFLKEFSIRRFDQKLTELAHTLQTAKSTINETSTIFESVTSRISNKTKNKTEIHTQSYH